MKNRTLFTLIVLFLALSLTIVIYSPPSNGNATSNEGEFHAEGLIYQINDDGKTVTLMGAEDSHKTGELALKGEVEDTSGNKYTVTSIGESAFSGCSGFTGSLNIPDSVTSINSFAFGGCLGFTGSLNIPDGVTSIMLGAFSGCSGFTGSLNIPDSVTSIGGFAFHGCSGFTGSLFIPNGVTEIAFEAFEGCSGFTGSLFIPNGVTKIQFLAFHNCPGFTTLAIGSKVNEIDKLAFDDWSLYDDEGNKIVITNPSAQLVGHVFSGTKGHITDLGTEKCMIVFINDDSTEWEILDKNTIKENLPVPSKPGYVLKGWSVDKRFLVMLPFKIDDNYMLYAIWEKESKEDAGNGISPLIAVATGAIGLVIGAGITYFITRKK